MLTYSLEDAQEINGRRERTLLALTAVFVCLNAITYSLVKDGAVTAAHLWAIGVWLLLMSGAHLVLHFRKPTRDPYLLPLLALLTGWGLVLLDRLAANFLARQVTWLALATAVLLGVATPIAALIVVYFAYTLVAFRRRPEEPDDAEGVEIRGNAAIQTTWLAVTSVIVLFLATYGTVRLFDNGSGGGQGSDPVAKQDGDQLQVQVIGQQWAFTYRWPAYGGMETPHLVLPVDQPVEMHVTSLDVIHSFWAHDLGIKADANPGVDNVVFVRAKKAGDFDIRCAELCGLFHGHMFDTGRVVSAPQFQAWIRAEQQQFSQTTPKLPPYSTHYNPEPTRRAG